MDLWVHINGEDYPIVPGCTLIDNLGEELDSMQISIPHVHGIVMKPYDDAYVHDGWYTGREYGKLVKPRGFYRHFLIFSYDRVEVNQLDNVYNYSISLVSETKYLEKVLMPNRTITIPFKGPGRSVFEMADIFVKRYSPKIKYSDDILGEENIFGTWSYKNRFIVSESNKFDEAYLRELNLEVVEDVFSNVQAMETSFNNPTLREALTKIFSVKNRIPVVRDGIIFCRNIAEKKAKISEIKGKIWDTVSMAGDQYCDRLRKNYSSGLTDKNGCIFHEYVGFRNTNTATMRYTDLQIEVKHPIYRINKFLICYYSNYENGKVKKIDMTDFVLPSSTRALLSNDYISFEKYRPRTINGFINYKNQYVLGLCDYKFMTVQYDIGSNVISGFGDSIKYTTNGVDYTQRIVFENVLNAAIFSQTGNKAFEDEIQDGDNETVPTYHGGSDAYVLSDIMAKTPPGEHSGNLWTEWYAKFSNVINKLFGTAGNGALSDDSMRMKSIFFEIEYQGIISSAVTVSKDLYDGDIYAIDNQQESLAVMEQDGITSKYKANRLGNEVSTVTARVYDMDDLVEIGDYDDAHGICYKRTIGLERDFVSANYTFSKEFVLTNYFTGVFSKYRSSAYASPSQSVDRNETSNIQLLLSFDRRLKNPNSDGMFKYDIPLRNVISIFTESDDIGNSLAYFEVDAPKQGEYAYNTFDDAQIEHQYFAMDRAYYMSGNSMCCSFGMPDSETAGTYIRQLFPDVTDVTAQALNASGNIPEGTAAYETYAFSDTPINDITGAAQDWLSLPKSRSDGVVKDMVFNLAFSEYGGQNAVYQENNEHTEDQVINIYDNHLLMLPKLQKSVIDTYTNTRMRISETYKDSKEVINETFQIEPITEEGIRVSPYFLKLSDIFNRVSKRRFEDVPLDNVSYPLFAVTDQNIHNGMAHSIAFYTKMGDYGLKDFKDALLNKTLDFEVEYDALIDIQYNDYTKQGKLYVTVHRIVGISDEKIDVEMSMYFQLNGEIQGGVVYKGQDDLYYYVRWISNPHFIASFWDSDYIGRHPKETVGLYQAEDGSYPNHRFYPDDDGDLPSYARIYDYIYATADTKPKPAYFEMVNSRKCFSFNFSGFPSTGNIMYYSGTSEDMNASGTLENVSYDSLYRILGIGGGLYYRDEALSVVNNSVFSTYDMADNNQGYGIPNQKGPGKSVVDSLERFCERPVMKANVVWALSESEIPDTFDVMKTYADMSESGLDTPNITPREFRRAEGGRLVVSINGYAENSSGTVFVHLNTNSQKTYKSAYMYYLDTDGDGLYHFVFGCNGDTENGLFMSEMYASLIRDRSRTVYNANMEPVLKTANYAKYPSADDNVCMDKNAPDK